MSGIGAIRKLACSLFRDTVLGHSNSSELGGGGSEYPSAPITSVFRTTQKRLKA